ncbi:hypothetical protein FRC10_000327, partial [Ceratobasidium sp. 414]
MPRSDDEESDIAMPSRSHSPDIPLAESGTSPTTPLDPNGPRYPQGNGLGHAGSTRNPDGTNCTRPVACFFCIKVELPCTGDFPTCVNCVRRNLPCAYPDPSSYAHQFPRQSAMHTRQLKDGTPHRSNAGGPHASPGRGQLTPSQPGLHSSRSHPGPLNQNHMRPGPTPPPMSASPDSMAHGRQRSVSGPNGLAGFGAEAIRSAAANVDNIPRSTSGSRPTSTASPARPSNINATHSRTPSTAAAPTSTPSGQPTLSNPIPLPALRSIAQSPSTPIQNHSQPPTRTPTQTPTLSHGQLPNQTQPPTQNQNPPAERVLDTVRGPSGDARSPVNGVLVSPSGRTRDASLVHGPGTHSRSGSTGQGDGFVHEGPTSYRVRAGEGDRTTPNDTPLRNGMLTTPTTQSHPRPGVPTGTPARVLRVPMRPPDSENEPTANANDAQRPDPGPVPAESRPDSGSDSGATRAPNAVNGTPSRHVENRPGPPATSDSRASASGPVQAPAAGSGAVPPTTPVPATTVSPAPPTKTGTGPDLRPASGNLDPRPLPEDMRNRPIKPDELRPKSEDQRLPRTEEPRPRLPDSLPRRPSVPSPITQHPARDLSIIAPMGRQDISRRDSGGGSGRYDPRRDIGVRDDRREPTLGDRRGSTSGRDSVNNWQARSNTQPRPLPPIDTRASNLNVRKEHSPHTPRNQPLPLEPRGGQARERSPARKSKSPTMGGTAGATTPQNNRSRAGSRRRSQSPRGIHLRAESGSIRSSPMDMD